MNFAAPAWLLLLPVLAIIGWRWPSLRLQSPLRAACLLLIVAALASPEWGGTGRGMDLWVLVDRSASAADSIAPHLREWETIVENARGGADRLRYVDFASDAVLRQPATVSELRTERTRLGQAIEWTLAKADPRRSTRVLAWTDGFFTDELEDARASLRTAKIPFDVRMGLPPSADDVRVTRFKVPSSVRRGEPILVDLAVAGADGEIPYELLRDGKIAGQGTLSLTEGGGQLRVTDSLSAIGMHRYEIRLLSKADSRPANNTATAWVEVRGGSKIMVVTNFSDDPVVQNLQNLGFDLDVVRSPRSLSAASLAGAAAVVINNVTAGELSSDFLDALPFFVESQGGGLWMIGGANSFGSGGYFQSRVDALLPVSMELREEHRKLGIAMAIVLDRSGSMAASAGSGLTKMDLANDGAARSVDLLGPSDSLTIFAVDSVAHEVVPLTRIGANRRSIADTVRRVESAGGGIFVYEGLKAAWDQFRTAPTGQKHIILFSDAADSEEPGAYKDLLSEMRAANATVSVIALGSEQDSDSALLKDIAERGGGRIFFNADATQLPAIFSQETVAVARSTYIRSSTPARPEPGWREISPRPLRWPAEVDGYNLCYARPGAALSLQTTDEFQAPLVASWQRGAGRVAAVTFPLSGPDSPRARVWPSYGDFVQTLGRWLAAPEPPPGTSLHTRVNGENATVTFRFDPQYEAEFARRAPVLRVMETGAEAPAEIEWERVQPGEFRARIGLPATGWLRGVVDLGEKRIAFGPLASAMDPEWSTDPRRPEEVRRLSRDSGGRTLQDLGNAWLPADRQTGEPLGRWLLGLALCVFVVECLASRLGFRFVRPQSRLERFKPKNGL